jgi:hypothetical protein
MVLSLEDYLRTHRETIRPWVLVKQLKQYQEQHAENHALLGDRLLDVYLYKMASILDLDTGADVTGDATHRRGEIFSNRSLSSFGNDLFEYLLEPEEWAVLPEDGRSTFVEAIVGACFHMEGMRFSEQFDVVIRNLVDRLCKAAQSRPTRSPISLVCEWLQAHGVDTQLVPSRFETKETGEQSFQTTIDFGLIGESRLLTGPECQSKKEAERLTAELVVAALGLGEVAPSEVRRVEPPAPVEIPDGQLVRDGAFAFQTLERERWDLEQTLEWFSQKSTSRKRYEAPFLLRAQLDNAFEIVGWGANLEEQFVAVMTAAFIGERYWSIGASKISRSQSKKAAVEELLKLVPFEDWIRRIYAQKGPNP